MADVQPLYPTRSGAGSQLGQQIYKRTSPPTAVLGITPSGVEVAANAAQAMGAKFDVIVTAHVRLENLGIVGAVAEDADAVLDPEFEPRFAVMEALQEAIDKAHRAVKTERLLFRGQRPLRAVEDMQVIIVDGHTTNPWKMLAAAEAVTAMGARRVVLSAAVSTQGVQERVRNRRFEFVCPSVILDPAGHPNPFGDPQDSSAERLRSIVIAREAA